MALTSSNPIALGIKAIDFKLKDTVSDQYLSLDALASNVATVIMFICNHCPFVLHVQGVLAVITNEYKEKGIQFIAISSNDVTHYPEDSPEKMKAFALRNNFAFPYFYDEDQSVAKLYDAACTPDFFVFDGELKLVYHGQFDDSRPGKNVPVTGEDLRLALDCLIEGKPVSGKQKPSMGCNIKWK